ncbi:LOW QUALITY PROTEIN: membrane metallo-endopeptidase-like 1 [Drosophila ficusphila]|uniref:LOW QUALITY PROTEIN: membrane metallo-endopeptidase-like 1 n=1 Tax=Drosophila ficusphila TaxID=30025 RepID=UPI0007E6F1ED|nr:LOW QUALITY PROTEIN: membrane metallo-endopeptidase-like 1 [Drosophila ficusphila]
MMTDRRLTAPVRSLYDPGESLSGQLQSVAFEATMLKLSLVAWLIFSLAWRTTPTACRQTNGAQSVQEMLAAQLQSYMDLGARSCDNFYQFACGNWQIQQLEHQEQHFPRDREWARDRGRSQEELLPGDTLGLIDQSVNRRVELLLRRRNETSSELDLRTLQQMRLYYRSCKRLKPYNLKKYLQLLPPGNHSQWPSVSRGWRPEQFDWMTTLGRLRLHGLNGVLLREEVLPRWDDSSAYSVYVNKPSRQQTLPMGEGAVIELLLDIGQTKRTANALARLVDEFERRLHRLQELEDDEGPREMQLGYLVSYLPQLRWLAFLGQLRPEVELDLRSTLIVENVPYLRALSELVEAESPDTVCSYIMLKWLAFLQQQGPAEISRGECVASLRRAMPLASSWLVGQQFSDPDSEAEVRALFQRLKTRFGQVLAENRLRLSLPLVQILQQKLRAVRLQVGFVQPGEEEEVEQYHVSLDLSGNSFYGNQLVLLRHRVEASHSLLTENFTGSGLRYLAESWEASNSSPLYVRPRNLVLVPHGLLQLPVWHRNDSALRQHAVMGFALAHELAHGFDMSGMDYDALGNIMGPVEEFGTSRQFRQGLHCLQQQMASGSKWVDEKLADFVALRLAYETFFGVRADKREPRDPLVPELSQRQLFFVSFAQFFCGRTPVPSPLPHSRALLDRAADELRVMQTLANFEEFSREFGCEKRAKMQASQRCRLW